MLLHAVPVLRVSIGGREQKINLPTQKNVSLSYKLAQMSGIQERYVNPFTDFGFKKLFGEEPNKDLEVAKFTREELLSYEDSSNTTETLKTH